MQPPANDVELLAVLGYKQEFKRAFRPLEVFGLAFSFIGLFPSIAYAFPISPPPKILISPVYQLILELVAAKWRPDDIRMGCR